MEIILNKKEQKVIEELRKVRYGTLTVTKREDEITLINPSPTIRMD
jgi:hypothetical protein